MMCLEQSLLNNVGLIQFCLQHVVELQAGQHQQVWPKSVERFRPIAA
jgi:hypothetical protein